MTATKELTLPLPLPGMEVSWITRHTASPLLYRATGAGLAKAVADFHAVIASRGTPPMAREGIYATSESYDEVLVEKWKASGLPGWHAGEAFGSGPSVQVRCKLDLDTLEWSPWQ